MGPEACSIPMFLLAIRFLVFANSMSVLTLKNITTVNDENELSVHKKKNTKKQNLRQASIFASQEWHGMRTRFQIE